MNMKKTLKRKNLLNKRNFAIILLIIVSLISLFPIIVSFYMSFIPDIKGGFQLPTRGLSLENYHTVIFEGRFLQYLLNSLLVTLATIAITIIIGTPAAYSLVRSRFRKKYNILTTIFSLRMFPAIVIVIPFFMIASFLKLMDTLIVLILINSAFNIPLVVWIIAQFFREVPLEIEEAATIDGCNEFRVFLKITLPISANALIATAVLTFIFTWNEFIFALTLTSYDARTLSVGLTEFLTPYGIAFGPMYASLLFVICPVLLFSLLARKYLISGLVSFKGGVR